MDRLHAIAALCRAERGPVWDVGFDHGRVLDACAGFGVENRPAIAGRYRQGGGRRPVLCADGFSALAPGAVHQAVCCGLGERRIIQILASGDRALATDARLVLGPHGRPDGLRPWLAAHRWRVVAEDLVYERGRYHAVLVCERGAEPCSDPRALLIGPRLVAERHPLLVAWLEDQLRRYRSVPADGDGDGEGSPVQRWCAAARAILSRDR